MWKADMGEEHGGGARAGFRPALFSHKWALRRYRHDILVWRRLGLQTRIRINIQLLLHSRGF